MKAFAISALAATIIACQAGATVKTVSTFAALKAGLESAYPGDVIALSDGTYNATGQITVSAENVALVSAGGKTAATVDGCSLYRILYVSGANFRIEGITFRNAHYAGNGGAISYSSSSVSKTAIIKNCDFIDCTAKYGGAIYAGQNSYTSFEPRENYGIVSGCTFLRCGIDTAGTDDWGGGGAIFGALWVEDSVFDACFCSDMSKNQYHAAIDVTRYATVSNCVFRNHSQTKRGLIGASEIYPETQQNGCVRLVDCIIANNTATDRDDVLFHRKVILDRCVISNNATTVTSTLLSLYRFDASGERGFSKVTSCLFIDNKYPFNMANMPPLLNCTFVRNVGGLACGKETSLNAAITNCVFWGNYEKTSWPNNDQFNGGPGLYWNSQFDLPSLIRIGSTVIEEGVGNGYLYDVLEADSSGKSLALTRAAADRGPGFSNAEKGDWSLKSKSPFVDAGVFMDWMPGAFDLAGKPRLSREAPDLGCFEWMRKASFAVYLK